MLDLYKATEKSYTTSEKKRSEKTETEVLAKRKKKKSERGWKEHN